MIRVIFGCLKVTLISSTVLDLHGTALASSGQAAGAAAALFFFLAAALYVVYLYVNFSGYMDIVVSLARLMGIKISENFNHPFSSRSFLELWTRWHITLANWFRFYRVQSHPEGADRALAGPGADALSRRNCVLRDLSGVGNVAWQHRDVRRLRFGARHRRERQPALPSDDDQVAGQEEIFRSGERPSYTARSRAASYSPTSRRRGPAFS